MSRAQAVDRVMRFEPEAIRALYGTARNLVLQRFPGLDGSLPWIPLGAFPTRIEELPWPSTDAPSRGRLFVKRDDQSSALYGGNKVRKLEHLLAEAKLAGRRTLLTLGGIGSNHAVATALFGRRLGLDSELFLFHQPVDAHVITNLRAMVAAGAVVRYARTPTRAFAALWRRFLDLERANARPYSIPAGGTGPLGNLGFIGAAFELAQQIERGVMPEPDRIYVAAGSCGTAAGLAAGCLLAGLRSRVVAVRVGHAIIGNSWNISRLAQRTLDLLDDLDRARVPKRGPDSDASSDASSDRRPHGDPPSEATGVWRMASRREGMGLRFEVEARFRGDAYGAPTVAGREAIAWAETARGLSLEPTYTAKALAACLADCRHRTSTEERTFLFWNTFNSATLELAPNIDSLPQELRTELADTSSALDRS